MISIRKAGVDDIDAVAGIYAGIHTEEESGRLVTGWIRGVYPERATAEAALARGDLFVMEDGGAIVCAAVLNQIQVDVYEGAPWEFEAPDDKVFVMHTLVVDSREAGKGYGSAMVKFYEDFALSNGCPFLRMDTNARNLAARRLYGRLGYKEIGTVPCVFNGIEGVQLVLLEKRLSE